MRSKRLSPDDGAEDATYSSVDEVFKVYEGHSGKVDYVDSRSRESLSQARGERPSVCGGEGRES